MAGIPYPDRPDLPTTSATCPKCGMTTHHPDDIRHGYCGKCHEFTLPTRGNIPGAGSTHVFVDGIVAARDHEPYVRLVVNGEKAQLSVAEAMKIAKDLLKVAARTEADAMLFRFFTDHDLPQAAAGQLMQEFRYFREMQDRKEVIGTTVDPDSGETMQ